MEHVTRALEFSTAAGNDINELLNAMRVLLRLCESRLASHSMLGPSPPEGSLRTLAADVNALHTLAGALGEVVAGLAATARAALVDTYSQLPNTAPAGSSEHSLRSACQQTLRMFDVASCTVRTVKEESIKQREVLLEVVLNRDLPSNLRSEIEQLIQRIGDQSRDASGAA
jgi:hypothetical protein